MLLTGGGVPAEPDVQGSDVCSCCGVVLNWCVRDQSDTWCYIHGPGEYQCVSGTWTEPFWMVRMVLSFSLIKNGENLI